MNKILESRKPFMRDKTPQLPSSLVEQWEGGGLAIDREKEKPDELSTKF